jgi:hypothetical protein
MRGSRFAGIEAHRGYQAAPRRLGRTPPHHQPRTDPIKGESMKEELQTKLVEILGSIQTAAGKAGDFAMTQLPDIAQSYVVYGRAYYVLMVVLGIVMAASSAWLLLRGRNAYNEGEEEFKKVHPKGDYRILYRDNYTMGVPYFLLSGVVGAFGLAILLGHISSALLVWFAPKVWLLKEIATLIK